MAVQETQSSLASADDEEEIFPVSGTEPGGVPMIEVLTEILRRKWFIAKLTGLAAGTGILISLVLPTRYTAVTRIMTPQQTPSSAALFMSQLTSTGAGALAAASGGLGLKSPNDIYIGLLDSRPIADAIVGKFELMK